MGHVLISESLLLCDDFEAVAAVVGWRVTSDNFQRVIDSVGTSANSALRVFEIKVLAAVKQEADLVTTGIEVSAGGVALIVYVTNNGPVRACIGVNDFLESLAVVYETLVAASRFKIKHGDLAGVVDSPRVRRAAGFHVNAGVLGTFLYKAMLDAGGVEVDADDISIVIDSDGLGAIGFRGS